MTKDDDTREKVGLFVHAKEQIQAFQIRKMGVLFALVVLIIFFSIMSGGRFITISNILTVARQVSLAIIVGVGLTFVMITANIDLAVGSYLALSGVFAAAILYYGTPWYVALIIIMIGMALVGVLVGIIVAKQRLNALITTLAMMGIARGVALAYTGGAPIYIKNETFISLGTGYIGPIPTPVVIAAVILVVGQFILRKTKFGRYVYATGGNQEAALTSGINVDRIKIIVFLISGMLSGLAGSILAGRLFSGNPTAGQGFELDVISAVVIGGTSLFGGVGSMWGTLIGALTVGIIGNGLTILGVGYFYQLIAKGVIIYIAILIDRQTQEAGMRSVRV
jgi:ribose/xylose/arabinose/galactoside ABC-type transport system permease subunit